MTPTTITAAVTEAAPKRFNDAVFIQHGACNPAGVARSLVQAIDEARAENIAPRQDAACKLICHQLVHILGMSSIDLLPDDHYTAAMKDVCAKADRSVIDICSMTDYLPSPAD